MSFFYWCPLPGVTGDIAGVTGVSTAAGAASSGKLVCVAGAIGVGERWYRFRRRVPLGVSTM